MEILVALIGLAGTIAAAVISSQRKEREVKKSYEPNAIPPGTRKNTILLVGMGRSGKTQFVSYFTSSEPKAERITNEFNVFKCSKQFEDKTVTYYLNDYRGQNFGQLINSFIREQFKPHTIIRYGDINSLVLVVDLFPSEAYENDATKQFPKIDKMRVKDHIDVWNQFALDAVFALLEKNSLQFVCLFINKIDKLQGGLSNKNIDEIKRLYKPLIDTLELRTSKSTAEFEVIIGSAFNGINMSGVDSVQSYLNKYSVPKSTQI